MPKNRLIFLMIFDKCKICQEWVFGWSIRWATRAVTLTAEAIMSTNLTVRDAAERIGVSIGTIYHLCAAGRLPHMRIGTGRGVIRIPVDALEMFSQKCMVGRWPQDPATHK